MTKKSTTMAGCMHASRSGDRMAAARAGAGMSPLRRYAFVLCAILILMAAACPPAWSAQDTLRVGKSSPGSFSFVPLDVGIKAGIFQKLGINVQIIGFSGGTKMHQALAADGIDVAFGSGPQMILTAKGAPMIAVAEMAGAPLSFAVIVPYDSPVRTLDDLRGKKIGVSGNPSLSSFMAQEIALTKGWGDKGIVPVAIGGENAGVVAALRAHLVDAVTFDLRVGLQLERAKQARVLAPCSDYITHFITHAIFAQDSLIGQKPDLLRRFLKAWFQTISFMQGHKALSVEVASKVTGAPADLEALEYDHLVPKFFSPNGRFVPEDLAAVGKSLVMLQAVTKAPDMSKLYRQDFLPQ